MKKGKTIFILILLFVMSATIIYIVTWLTFHHDGRNWLEDRGTTLTTSCKKVDVGDSVDDVLRVMGTPDSRKDNDNQTTLLYLRGGLISDQGLSFDFEDGKLIRTDCEL